jgi:CubicO group peptidase (beta-lactamase class C family)
MARRLDAAIQHALDDKRIVGTVVLVARNGDLVYHTAAGLADREARVPMRDDAIFLLASVAKPFVTAAALRLVEQGKLQLSDPVTRWLPDFRPRTATGDEPTITIHQLLTHTAGLTYRFMEPAGGPYHQLGVSDGLDDPGLTLEENLARIARAPLSYVPGTSWGYSVALDVIGAVIERVTHTELPTVVAELVTTPLGIRDTGFSVVDRQRLVTHYADGTPEPTRIHDGEEVPYYGASVKFAPSRVFDPNAFPSGGAGLVGTARDVLTLLEALRTGGDDILTPATVHAMMTDHVGAQAQTQGPGWGFGYGGAVLVDPSLTGTPQSPGTFHWIGAYGHSWFIDPAKALTVVALTNTTFEGMSGRFTTDVRDAVYG